MKLKTEENDRVKTRLIKNLDEYSILLNDRSINKSLCELTMKAISQEVKNADHASPVIWSYANVLNQ